jgi:hypothetical protein
MGRSYHFECPLCHYQACVSGGADHGVNCSVQTISCRNCRELFDVLTRVRRKGFAEPAARQRDSLRILKTNHLVIPPLMLVEHTVRNFPPTEPAGISSAPNHWENLELACPISSEHRIRPWNEPGRCPRCGNYMEKNGYPHRIWD